MKSVLKSDLDNPPQLREFGLQFQKRLNLLCCLACGICLTSRTGISHVKFHLRGLKLRVKKSHLIKICEELGVHNVYPSITDLSGTEALSGLKLYTKALLCPEDHCNAIFASGGAMRHHYRHTHGGKVPDQWTVVPAQKLDKNRNVQYFRVQPPPPAPEPTLNSSWLDDLEADIARINEGYKKEEERWWMGHSV